MCVRGNATCTAARPSPWVVQTGKPAKGRGNTRTTVGSESTASKRRRVSEVSQVQGQGQYSDKDGALGVPETDGNGETTTWKSSSTLLLVEEAFHHHNATSPDESKLSAFSAGQWTRPNRARRRTMHLSGPALSELLSLVPDYETASLLVDNYFNRIHWFMLVFHQRHFRLAFHSLYHQSEDTRIQNEGTGQNWKRRGEVRGDTAYIAVLLAVCAISLHYTTSTQRKTLSSKGLQVEEAKHSMLAALQRRLLDILALGSLQSVQMCVLLGSFYLYHGQPELAWPLCGCALRLAQALNLHRKQPQVHGESDADDNNITASNAARQRCWWAVYEVETFCSMMYGFPLSISDCDCDVDKLSCTDTLSASVNNNDVGTTSSRASPNLLMFKCGMAELSIIIKDTLRLLYGATASKKSPTESRNHPVTALVGKVETLNTRLKQWCRSLNPKIRPENLNLIENSTHHQPSSSSPIDDYYNGGNPNSEEEVDPAKFNEKLFQLQAMALKLAYENATILINRPLLSYQTAAAAATTNRTAESSSTTTTNPVPPTPHHHHRNNHPPQQSSKKDPFQSSKDACREAALQISLVGRSSSSSPSPSLSSSSCSTTISSSSTFPSFFSTTYGVPFASLHLFTAGITLCIVASLEDDPLSPVSHECKIGVRRVMVCMQAAAAQVKGGEAAPASQGLEVLRKLVGLVVRREMESIVAEVGGGRTGEEERKGEQEQEQEQEQEEEEVVGDPGRLSDNDDDRGPSEQQEESWVSGGDDLLGGEGQFGFCENLSMTQAVFDFEQALMERSTIDDNMSSMDMGMGNVDTNQTVGTIWQDQGWMWGWNFDE